MSGNTRLFLQSAILQLPTKFYVLDFMMIAP